MAHQCDDCGKVFRHKDYLQQHIRTHSREENNKKPYQCNLCGKSFHFRSTFAKHLQVHSHNSKCVEQPYNNCSECVASFPRKTYYSSITERQNRGKNNTAFECEECGKTFHWKVSLRYHIRTHTGKKRKIHNRHRDCEEVGTTSDNLVAHLNNIHTMGETRLLKEEEDFQTEGGYFKTEGVDGGGYFNNIVIRATEIPTKECGKPLQFLSNLSNQLNNLQNNKRDSSSSYTCSVCNAAFEEKGHLKDHNREHSRLRFQCEICGKMFRYEYTLNEHIIDHNGKSHKCNVCGVSFNRAYYLLTHLRKHNEEKPYQCPVCSVRMARHDTYEQHLLLHVDPTFKCKVCKKSFKNRIIYNNHVESHTRNILEKFYNTRGNSVIKNSLKSPANNNNRAGVGNGSNELMNTNERMVEKGLTKSVGNELTKPLKYGLTKFVKNTLLTKPRENGLENFKENGLFKKSVVVEIAKSVEGGLNKPYENGLKKSEENGLEKSEENGLEKSVENGVEKSAENGFKNTFENGFKTTFENGLHKHLENGVIKSIENDGLTKSLENGHKITLKNGLTITLGNGLKNPVQSRLTKVSENGHTIQTAENGLTKSSEGRLIMKSFPKAEKNSNFSASRMVTRSTRMNDKFPQNNESVRETAEAPTTPTDNSGEIKNLSNKAEQPHSKPNLRSEFLKPLPAIEFRRSRIYRGTLMAYLKTITKPKRHKCHTCGKCFPLRVDLKVHHQSHNEGKEKPYQCRECGATYKSGKSLLSHFRTHYMSLDCIALAVTRT